MSCEGISRRELLRRSGMLGGAALAFPEILAGEAAAAALAPPPVAAPAGVVTSITRTPTPRRAASYTLRECLGMTTSSLANPLRFGMRMCRSGLPPATQAAVAWVRAAEQPLVTRPHSAPVSVARRAPIASASSSRCT